MPGRIAEIGPVRDVVQQPLPPLHQGPDGRDPDARGRRRPAGADPRLDAAASAPSRRAARSIRAARTPSTRCRVERPERDAGAACIRVRPAMLAATSRGREPEGAAHDASRRSSRCKTSRRVFDVSKPWLNRVIEGERTAYLKAVDDVSFADRQARDLGAGRRIRLGQVDGGPHGGRPAAADRRRGQHRRHRHVGGGARRRAPAAAPAHPDDLPGPLRQPQSALAGGRIIAEPIRAFGLAKDNAEIAAPRRRAADAGRPRSGRRRQVPARVLRRPAPAHLHRPRACLEPGVHRLRRADLARSTCRCRRRS